MKNRMIKRIMVMAACVTVTFSMVGCGKSNEVVAENVDTEVIEGDEGIPFDYPENFMEERTEKYVFDSNDEIISLLENGEAYGYAKVMGSDEDILFITDETFDGYGFPASITVYPYLKNADGKYVCGGVINSMSTATPISITPEGYILVGNHQDCSKLAIEKDIKSIMVVEYVYIEFNEDGTDGTYGGFIRESNSLSAPQTEIAADDSKAFEDAFSAFDTATPIAFTVVNK